MCLRENVPFPEKIQNAPDLGFGLLFFYQAFLDLVDCRQMGMALGPIPWTAVNDYCARYEIEGEQAEILHYHVKHLDAAFLEAKNRK